MAVVKVTELELKGLSGGMQARAGIDEQTVQDYAQALRDNDGQAQWPPIVVYKEVCPPPKRPQYWLADGFHRVAAARLIGAEALLAEVREGNQWDALRYALSANGTHGLRRSRADIANAIRMAYENRLNLGISEVPSARLVAELVGCSDKTAGDELRNIRSWAEARARTGADGKTRPVPPRRPPPPPPPLPPKPGETDGETPAVPLRSGEEAIAARQTAETNAAVAAYMKAHPNVSYCQALAIVSRNAPTTPAQPAPQASSAVLDETGREVPPELFPIWSRRQAMKEILSWISKARSAVRNLQDTEDPVGLETNFSSALAHANQFYADAETLVPYAVCPSCHGLIGCRLCGGRGVISKFRWDTCVSRETKAALGVGERTGTEEA